MADVTTTITTHTIARRTALSIVPLAAAGAVGAALRLSIDESHTATTAAVRTVEAAGVGALIAHFAHDLGISVAVDDTKSTISWVVKRVLDFEKHAGGATYKTHGKVMAGHQPHPATEAPTAGDHAVVTHAVEGIGPATMPNVVFVVTPTGHVIRFIPRAAEAIGAVAQLLSSGAVPHLGRMTPAQAADWLMPVTAAIEHGSPRNVTFRSRNSVVQVVHLPGRRGGAAHEEVSILDLGRTWLFPVQTSGVHLASRRPNSTRTTKR